MPFGFACKGDIVHSRMCDYMAGQARLLELRGGLCKQDWACREYPDMVLIARERLVCEGKDECIVAKDERNIEEANEDNETD